MTFKPMESTQDGPTNHAIPTQRCRFGWAIVALGLLLSLLGLGAYLLIQLPGGVQAGLILENETAILTGVSRRIGTDHEFNYQVYSLRTGQTHEFTSALQPELDHNTLTWVELEAGHTWHARLFDSETFAEVSLGKVVLSTGQVPQDVHANGLIAGLDQKSNLFVSDPHTGRTRQLELPSLASNRIRSVRWHGHSPQLIVSEYLTPGGGPLTFRWYTWIHDKIELRGEWSSSTWPHIAGEELLRVGDNQDLDILRLADGAVVETQSLRDRFNLQPGVALQLMAVIPPIAVFQLSPKSPKNFVVYDYRQQRILGELDGMRNNAPVIRPGSLIFDGREPPRSKQKLSKLYSWEGTLLSSIPLDERTRASLRTADGKRLMVLSQDESIREIDLLTGKTLRSWRSKAWVLPMLLSVILGFCVWFGCWIRLSHSIGWHPLSDVAVWNGLIAAGTLSRVYLRGPSDSAAIIIECLALALSWLQFGAVWSIFGPMRWSLRALVPMLAATGAVGALLIVFRHQPLQIPLIIAVAAIGMFVLVGVLSLPYRWGWRLVEPGLQLRPVELRPATKQMPLRDLFAIVGALGLFLAVARFVPFQGNAVKNSSVVITHVVAGLGSASVGVWAALSPRHWTLRLAVFLCAILAFACLPGLHDFRFWSWGNWWMFLRFPAATAVFVAGSLLAFRVRGWRWMRTAK